MAVHYRLDLQCSVKAKAEKFSLKQHELIEPEYDIRWLLNNKIDHIHDLYMHLYPFCCCCKMLIFRSHLSIDTENNYLLWKRDPNSKFGRYNNLCFLSKFDGVFFFEFIVTKSSAIIPVYFLYQLWFSSQIWLQDNLCRRKSLLTCCIRIMQRSACVFIIFGQHTVS